MSQLSKKPIAIVLGAAFALSGAAAEASVFQTNTLNTGYMVAADTPKAGEGKCGEMKAGEGKCGGKKAGHDKAKDQQPSNAKPADKQKTKEGKCGEMKKQ